MSSNTPNSCIERIQFPCAALLGVVYREMNRLGDAERTFQDCIRRYGEDGVMLANLAKIYSLRGNTKMAESALWHALELDPNQDFGLGWFWSVANEKGEQAGIEALRRVAALPRSWRARMWLARPALQQGKKTEALGLYDEMLAMAPRPAPADMLMQMSGDLGKHGLLAEALKLTIPHFDPVYHGLEVGNNLIKANLDLGRLDHARAIVEQLYALKRPDFQQYLDNWEVEIAKARATHEGTDLPRMPRATMLSIEGPLWLSSAAARLFPSKGADAVVVCFLAGTADVGVTGSPRLQFSGTCGRLARGLALFLSEQFHVRTDGIGQMMQPLTTGSAGGLVLAVEPWQDEFVIAEARACHRQGDYVALSHFAAVAEPYEVSVRLVRTIDGSELAATKTSLDPKHPEAGFTELANWVLTSVCHAAHVGRQDPPAAYQVPHGEAFSFYQLRLEQALAVLASAAVATNPDFLSGEREIVMGNLQLCLDQPTNVTTRLLLASTLQNLKNYRPQVIAEFRDKVELLQSEKPLPSVAHDVLQEILDEVYS